MAECQAQSTHTVSIENAVGVVTYEWSVTPNAFIVSGQGTPTVVVGTLDEAFVTFTVTCLATDDNGNSVYSSTFTHERVVDDIANTDTFYIMDVPLVAGAIPDYAVSDPVADGTLHESGGATWTPTAEEYAEDGIITIAGDSGRYIEVPHPYPSDEAWQFVRCYDVDGRNFKIMVIVYSGAGKASFLYGDQDTYPVLTDGNTNLDYTPMGGNYQITEFLDVPAEEITYEMDAFSLGIEHTYEMDDFIVDEPPVEDVSVYIAFNQTTPPQNTSAEDIDMPAGVTINHFLKETSGNTTERALVDTENQATPFMIRLDGNWETASKAIITGDESDALSDYQMVNSWTSAGNGKPMNFYLTAGTYTITISAASGQTETQEYTWDGDPKYLLMTQPQPGSVGFVDKVYAVDGWVTLTVSHTVGSNSRIGGINITKTA